VLHPHRVTLSQIERSMAESEAEHVGGFFGRLVWLGLGTWKTALTTLPPVPAGSRELTGRGLYKAGVRLGLSESSLSVRAFLSSEV
jgi:hypothetical protein